MEHQQKLAEEARKAGLLVWQEFPDTPDQVFGRFSKLEADLPKSFDVFLSFNQSDYCGNYCITKYNYAYKFDCKY